MYINDLRIYSTVLIHVWLFVCSVEVVFDDQCDVMWTLPEGVETIPLFQTTSFNIDGECLDLIGGIQGRTFHFQVRERERKRNQEREIERVSFVYLGWVWWSRRAIFEDAPGQWEWFWWLKRWWERGGRGRGRGQQQRRRDWWYDHHS